MPLPLLAKVVGGGLLAWAVTRKKTPAGPSSPNAPGAVPSPTRPDGSVLPIAERMAGRLRQEGYPAQAAELEREAGRIEAGKAPTPPVVVAPLPPGSITSAGLPPVVRPSTTAPVFPTPPVVIQTPLGPISVPPPGRKSPITRAQAWSLSGQITSGDSE